MEKCRDMPLASLLAQFAHLIERFAADEKTYLNRSLKYASHIGLAGIILSGAAVELPALSGAFLLVTLTL
ncbi:MAG: hypothetical protein BWZ01_01030 [Deltaproteobacteria bacterium ADurb.BinA179]|jgi:hypothetical protein|nr:hypothetical protein [Deltaproteobacteria bacterium]MDI9543487.1 hypothetical protein [Pseudomonadota bacterium]OPZ28673.1 MAG: hypothetical protein BWZ01_01030 [Deltaproteobacteria bacterium ADurb.BinA179]HRR22038.1 hypothetical protein [Desulfomonilia bacterium]HNU75321.1 hypothetical protein [Deltaproteobacteria bacterium]